MVGRRTNESVVRRCIRLDVDRFTMLIEDGGSVLAARVRRRVV